MTNVIWVCCCLGGLLIVGTLCMVLIKILPPQLKYQRLPCTADLIDYATLVEENVIALKSGGLMSVYTIKLPDLSMKPQAYINHIYEVSQKTLLKLNGNYCLHLDVVRNRSENYLPFLEVTNPVLQDLEERRKVLFANQGCFYSELFLTITFMGSSASDEILKDLMIKNESADEINAPRIKVLSEFKQACYDVVTSLKQCFDIRPLGVKTIPLTPQVARNYLDYIAQHPDKLIQANRESQDINVDRVAYQLDMQKNVIADAILTLKRELAKQKAQASTGKNADTDNGAITNADACTYADTNTKDSPYIDTDTKTTLTSTPKTKTGIPQLATGTCESSSCHAPCTNKNLSVTTSDTTIIVDLISPLSTDDTTLQDQAKDTCTFESTHNDEIEVAKDFVPSTQEYISHVATNKENLSNESPSLKAHTHTHDSKQLDNTNVVATVDNIDSKNNKRPIVPKESVTTISTIDNAERTSSNLSQTNSKKGAPSKEQVQTVIDNSFLAKISGRNKVLKIHEGLSFLHNCVTGSPAFLSTPSFPCFIDSIIGNQDFQPGFPPVMGQQYVGIIALEGLPNESTQGMLDQLATLPFVYRFSTRFVYFDNMQSNLLLSKYRRLWDQKLYGFFAQLFQHKVKRSQNAEQKVSEVDSAIRALDNNEIIFGSYTACIVIMDLSLNLLQSKLRDTVKVVESLGFTARIETINATEAFLGSLPGHFFENLRRPIVSQDVLMDFIPLSVPALGEMVSPNHLYGENKSPLMQVRTAGMSTYLLNLHDQDLGNTLVVGPPGSGKSVLLGAFIINLLRYRHMRVFAFDHGYSFYALTKALQGKHFELSNGATALCPLLDIEDSKEADYALNFLITMYEVNNVRVDPEDHKDLKESIRILSGKSKRSRSLSDFHMVLTNTKLKDGLLPFLNYHSSNSILDGHSNPNFDEILNTFECGDVFKINNRFAMPVLKHLFHLLEKKFDGNPAALVLDEAWLLLQHPTFSAEIIKWIKTLRKLNVVVILATQTLSDLEHSSEFNNLLECAKTRVYLANYSAESLPIALQYSKLGLSPKEIYAIAHAQAKRDYFFVKGEQHVMFNLVMSKPEIRLLSFAGPQNKPLVDHLYQAYGPKFYAQAS